MLESGCNSGKTGGGMHPKLGRTLGITLFILGMLIGLLVNAAAVYTDLEGMSFWGSPEGTSFDSTAEIDGRLGNLSCPLVLNTAETGNVRIKVTNPTDHTATPWIQASISDPTQRENIRREKQMLQIEPGGTVDVSWQVDATNRIFNRVVFVRIYLMQTQYHPPAATRHCGIIMLDFGSLSGSNMILLVSGFGFLLMIGGLFLWRKYLNPQKRRDSRGIGIMAWLTGLIAANLLANLAGWMVLAAFLLLLIVIFFIALFESTFTHQI